MTSSTVDRHHFARSRHPPASARTNVKMEPTCSSKTLVHICQTTWHHISKDCNVSSANVSLQYSYVWPSTLELDRLHLKCDGTHAETRFHISAKKAGPFKSAGASVQSTTGSRGVRISGSNVGYNMFRGSVKGTGYPLHSPVSPSLPLPRVVCRHISTGLYCSHSGIAFCNPAKHSTMITAVQLVDLMLLRGNVQLL
jgi:hypothetical protein